MNDEDDTIGEVIDFLAQKSLGSCPKYSGYLFEHGKKFVFEKSVASAKDLKDMFDFSLGLEVKYMTQPNSAQSPKQKYPLIALSKCKLEGS